MLQLNEGWIDIMRHAESYRSLLIPGAALIGAIGLTGCGGSDRPLHSPESLRYANDYVQETKKFAGPINEYIPKCLLESPYDNLVRPDQLPESIVRPNQDGTVSVVPSRNYAVTLRFRDEGTDKPLQPVDEATKQVLEEKNCNWQAYPED